MDVPKTGLGSEFYPALTDAGICNVYNGDSMKSTFDITTSERVKQLANALDMRKEVKPEMIQGAGSLYQKTFWVDITDRYHIGASVPKSILLKARKNIFRSLNTYEDLLWPRGSAMISFNNWKAYFNVRPESMQLFAGREYLIKVRDAIHCCCDISLRAFLDMLEHLFDTIHCPEYKTSPAVPSC